MNLTSFTDNLIISIYTEKIESLFKSQLQIEHKK